QESGEVLSQSHIAANEEQALLERRVLPVLVVGCVEREARRVASLKRIFGSEEADAANVVLSNDASGLEVRGVRLSTDAKRRAGRERDLVLAHGRDALRRAVLAISIRLVDLDAPERMRRLALRSPEQ